MARHILDWSRVRRHLAFMKTAVSSKGRIVLPAELRQQDGVVDWLLDCPGKDFFVPIESEYRLAAAVRGAEPADRWPHARRKPGLPWLCRLDLCVARIF